jgi:transcriptional regulator with GAF, ATPase, and Fis domain
MSIEAVLCVPFFSRHARGVLYLQSDKGFRSNAEKIKLDTELFARHVSPLLEQLLIEQERLGDSDPMSRLRSDHQLGSIVGQSAKFVDLLKSAMMIAPLEVTTLLLGETGTGKTHQARLIHENSHRKQG